MRYISIIFLCLAFKATAQLVPDHIQQIREIALAEQRGHTRIGLDGISTNPSNFDVKYYRCEWEVDPAVRYINGKVTVYYVITDAATDISLDLMAPLIVDSVMQHGVALNINQTSTTIQINFPSTVAAGTLDSLSVYYQGVPTTTGFGSFIQDNHAGTPVMWSLSEPYGARDWWPCKNWNDDKADSIDVYVTAPSQYTAASNGLLQSITPISGARNVTHWKHRYPIATYLMCFAVTNYATFNNTVQLGAVTLPMQTFCYPEDLVSFQNGTQNVLDAMQLYNGLIGDYPFMNEKYGHVQFGWGGGMEHQTSTFIVSIVEYLITHELAHQWFGDKITCGSWQDIWLNEGFATFFSSYYTENKYPQFTLSIRKDDIDYITAQPDGSVWVNDTTDVNRVFDNRLSYSKGSHVLYMLRWMLGDTVFFNAIRNYQSDPTLIYNFARTSDLKRHFELASGRDLTSFFNEWYTGQGYPSYNVEWANGGYGNVSIKMNQTTSHPSVSFFELPVALKFKNATQDTTVIVDNTVNGEAFIKNIGFVADTVLIDPDIWLITRNNTTTKLPDIILPIKLKSFDATKNGCTANINFVVSTATNVASMEMEYSTDGIAFAKAGTIKNIVNTGTEKTYNFSYPMQPGKNYFFRLKIINDDGSYTYGPVSKVNSCGTGTINIVITPNPVNNIATVTGMAKGKNTITIYGANAQLIQTIGVNNNSTTINFDKYASGIYMVQVQAEDGQVTYKKIVKK